MAKARARAKSSATNGETTATLSFEQMSAAIDNGFDPSKVSNSVEGIAQLNEFLNVINDNMEAISRLKQRYANEEDVIEWIDEQSAKIKRLDGTVKSISAGNMIADKTFETVESDVKEIMQLFGAMDKNEQRLAGISERQLSAIEAMRDASVSNAERDAKRHEEMLGAINTQSKSINNAMTNMSNIVSSVMSGDVNGIVSGTSGLFKELGSIKENMLDASDSPLIQNIGGKLGGILKKVGGPIAIASGVMAGIGVLEKSADVLMNARDVSLNQTGEVDNFGISAGMGFESQMIQAFTNLDASQVKNIQSTLISNRALYGSEEYEQGMDFAVEASQTRGINAATAAQLYANAVVKGTMSIDQLNMALDNLQETVKGTDITMDEAVKGLNTAIQTMTKGYSGGNESYGTELGIGLESLAGGDQLNVVQSIAGLYSTDDAYVNQQIAAYQQANGVDYATATAAVTMDLLQSGYGVGGASDPLRKLNTLPIDGSGKKFWDYYNAKDASGFMAAVTNLKSGKISDAMLPYGTFLQAMKKMGIPDGISNDPQKLTDFLFGAEDNGERTGGMVDVYSENNIQTATVNNLDSYTYVSDAVASGLMTSEEAASLTEDELSSLNESLKYYDDGSYLQYEGSSFVDIDDLKSSSIKYALKNAGSDSYASGSVVASEQKGNHMVVTIKLADGAEKYITYAVNDENDQITADSGR